MIKMGKLVWLEPIKWVDCVGYRQFEQSNLGLQYVKHFHNIKLFGKSLDITLEYL